MIVAGVLAFSALILTACSDDADSRGAADGHDPCLLGTWTVDMEDLASQFPKVVPYPGGTGQSSGTVTVTFADQMTVQYANHFDVSVSIGGFPSVMSVDYQGTASSTEWRATDGRLTGAMEAGTSVAVNAVLKNAYTSKSVDAPARGDLRLSDEAHNYTCTGTAATISAPNQTAIAWKLAKSG
jgi:hypothetical protein